jgi:hypothetical protein
MLGINSTQISARKTNPGLTQHYFEWDSHGVGPSGHTTEIDFALSFGAVIVKMIDLSKTESRDFFGIILDQKNSQKLHFLPKS